MMISLSISSCGKESYDLPDGDIVTPIAIDLGIRVDGKTIKWASFNLGATGGPDGAFNLGIDINDEGAGIWSNSRCYGFPIRPVYVME